MCLNFNSLRHKAETLHGQRPLYLIYYFNSLRHKAETLELHHQSTGESISIHSGTKRRRICGACPYRWNIFQFTPAQSGDFSAGPFPGGPQDFNSLRHKAETWLDAWTAAGGKFQFTPAQSGDLKQMFEDGGAGDFNSLRHKAETKLTGYETSTDYISIHSGTKRRQGKKPFPAIHDYFNSLRHKAETLPRVRKYTHRLISIHSGTKRRPRKNSSI